MLPLRLCSSDQQGGKEIEPLSETPPVMPIAHMPSVLQWL